LVSRRSFIKSSALCGAAVVSGLHYLEGKSPLSLASADPLLSLSGSLLSTWCSKLLEMQITDASSENFGGILCPAKNIIHGRIGDTLYPFLYLADKNKDTRYLDGAIRLYQWMEKHVSQSDGSWLNEPVKDSWKGTTVFSIIALGDALKHHGKIFPKEFKTNLIARLKKAGDYVYNNFSLEYGNINYPISAAYALSLLGEILDERRFREKGKWFAHESLRFITTKDGFIYGEGGLTPGAKGSYAIDLGYNVEESLPSLVLYGLMTKDEEVLEAATHSMNTHLEFMLPDGGWDNSWGTRSFKWTYWGSRTSDGCQPAYGLLADKNPVFYKAALRNTELLAQCTKDGLLQGGLHAHGKPSVHHTFCHAKALATLLDFGKAHPQIDVNKLVLPREKSYGARCFTDINTWVVSKGKFRGTLTAYEKEYKQTQNGHPSGGALSLLWHEKAGIIFSASMNQYQLIEGGNMLANDDPYSMPLTPRIELKTADSVYMNISDLSATLEVIDLDDELGFGSASTLVDGGQNAPSSGEVKCVVSYGFSDDKVRLNFSHNHSGAGARIIFPVISQRTEEIRTIDDKTIAIQKSNCSLKISANKPIQQLPSSGRIYNNVPGLEAIPFYTDENEIHIEITVE
jgi:hypothetical protein